MSEDKFQFFCNEFKRFQILFGLTDWEVCFEHKSCYGCRAYIHSDARGKIATVGLSKRANRNEPLEDISRSAFHEACHLLLADLTKEAAKRYASEDALYSMEEEVVRRLEHAFHKILVYGWQNN